MIEEFRGQESEIGTDEELKGASKMKTARQTIVGIMAVVAILGAGGTWAGDLTPPGAPGSTMHTLEEIYQKVASRQAADGRTQISQADLVSPPYVITNSGSYVLTENLAVTNTGTHGISVQADNVTIDLNGFQIAGPGIGASLCGVFQSTNGYHGLAVLNGKVIGWGSSVATYDSGILAGGSDARIEGVQAQGNLIGIAVRSGLVRNCSASSNTLHGIFAAEASVVRDCRSLENHGTGYFVGSGCVISHSSAMRNTGTGIEVDGDGTTVSYCASHSNDGDGIYIDGGGCSVVDCVTRENKSDGIRVTGSGTIIRGCATRWNRGDGIDIENHMLVEGNHSFENGYEGDGAGIFIWGHANTIKNNEVAGNDRGIHAQGGASNFIIGNSAIVNPPAVGGSNYVIAAGNAYGPIVNVNAVGDITGTPNASHPWANFEH